MANKFPLRDDHFAGGKNITEPAGDPDDLLPRLLNALRPGVYSNTSRPATGDYVGHPIFNVDEGVGGAPQWWNGSAWVNANGVPT